MTIRELRWLLELRNQMNFTKAAESCFTTQSALSQCLVRVESELGFSLFDRNRRYITLTENGARFLSAAEEMVQRYDTCLHDIRAADKTPFSTITIGVTPYINSFATGKITELRQAYPQLKIRLLEGSSEELVRRFREGELQIISVNDPIKDMKLHRIILDEFILYILLRKGSPASKFAIDTGHEFPELDPVHLAEEPLASSAVGSYSMRMAMSIYHQAGIKPEFVQMVTRPTTLCSLAKNGTATSIFALSKEVRDTLSDGEYIYCIPEHYEDSIGHRYLMCRRESIPRFPQGFLSDLGTFFLSLLRAA